MVMGILLIGVGLFLSGQHQDNGETVTTQAMQPEVMVHVVTQANQTHLSVTSVCASCHSLDSSIPLRDNSLESSHQLAQLEHKFNSVGNRLLHIDHPDDLRFAESVDNFWQIHQHMKSIQMSSSSSSDDVTDALASLALIDQQITFVQHEIDFGYLDSSPPKPRQLSIALASSSRTTFGHTDASVLVQPVTNAQKSTVDTVTSPDNVLDITACPRGPPATFIATTAYLKTNKRLASNIGVQSLLFFRFRERNPMQKKLVSLNQFRPISHNFVF
jgi:hypothetical protein